jgi:hypothetical protein
MSSNDTLGREVQKRFCHNSSLVDTMTKIINAMSDAELEEMINLHNGLFTFREKMEELVKLADNYCVFEGIKDVDPLLMGQDDEEEKNKKKTKRVETASSTFTEETHGRKLRGKRGVCGMLQFLRRTEERCKESLYTGKTREEDGSKKLECMEHSRRSHACRLLLCNGCNSLVGYPYIHKIWKGPINRIKSSAIATAER